MFAIVCVHENLIKFNALLDLLIDYRDEHSSLIVLVHVAYKGKAHFQKFGYSPNQTNLSQFTCLHTDANWCGNA